MCTLISVVKCICAPDSNFLTYVEEVNKVMLHTKYQGSRLCDFREDFFLVSLYNPI